VNRFLLLAAFFAPRRIAKFLGLHGGKRRRRQEPQMSLARAARFRARIAYAAAAGVVVATTLGLLAFLHLTSYKGVPR
jgi:hypothetical protein